MGWAAGKKPKRGGGSSEGSSGGDGVEGAHQGMHGDWRRDEQKQLFKQMLVRHGLWACAASNKRHSQHAPHAALPCDKLKHPVFGGVAFAEELPNLACLMWLSQRRAVRVGAAPYRGLLRVPARGRAGASSVHGGEATIHRASTDLE